jgi:cobalt/nickel transport system permease protein
MKHPQSTLHDWESSLKIVGFISLILSIASLTTLTFAFIGLGIALGLVWLAGISWRYLLGKLRWLLIFLLPLFLLLPLEVNWDQTDGFTCEWNPQGLQLAGVVCLRAITLFLLMFPMWNTAPLYHSLQGLHRLGIPAAWIQLLHFCSRYTMVYLRQLQRMKYALQARAFTPTSLLSFSRKRESTQILFKVLGSQIAMLLITSFEQAERVLKAMQARGYEGVWHGCEAVPRSGRDWLKCGVFGIFSVVLLLGDKLWQQAIW